MMIVAVRTDNPQAELYLYKDGVLAQQEIWQAHRELSATIHLKLKALLEAEGKHLHDIQGLIFYQGPGSFTGLRIGVSVVNALGSSLAVPVAATKGGSWREDGLKDIAGRSGFMPVEPFYGAEATITQPKK